MNHFNANYRTSRLSNYFCPIEIANFFLYRSKRKKFAARYKKSLHFHLDTLKRAASKWKSYQSDVVDPYGPVRDRLSLFLIIFDSRFDSSKEFWSPCVNIEKRENLLFSWFGMMDEFLQFLKFWIFFKIQFILFH